jgi:diaminohydroxyphosphoribosylaminopyrimidine deaminase/5-amino-6-(5-phosphoribosylamino)uracil reductase
VVAHASIDEHYMRRALFHAARGLGRTTPNPMVGAVVVANDGVVVGHGYHERAGEPHAEVRALAAAGERARGATLYVTLEPCCHVGRTGPCTGRILAAGVSRVVAAMQDPDTRVSGQGFAELRAHGVTVDVGSCAEEALALNQGFVTVKRLGRPFVMLKAAASLDARVAAARGERTAITSPDSNRKSQRLRASVDAIAVGSETVLVDDPLLTARGCCRERPLVRVVFDRRLRTPPGARLFSTLRHGPVIIVTGGAEGVRREALAAAGAVLLDAKDLESALGALLSFDVSTLLVEGGPTLHGAFAAAGLVDRLHLIVAPQMLGPRGVEWLDVNAFAPAFVSPPLAEPRGVDIWIEGDVHRHR